MSKEKQIEEMAKDLRKSEHWEFNDTSVDFELDHRKTAKNLYNEGYRKQSEWISVEERLPDREGTYLVYTYKGAIKFGDFRCYYASGDEPQFDYYVTHWMPLPEAPKGGEG